MSVIHRNTRKLNHRNASSGLQNEKEKLLVENDYGGLVDFNGPGNWCEVST